MEECQDEPLGYQIGFFADSGWGVSIIEEEEEEVN